MTVSPEADRLALLVHEVRSPAAALAAIAETLGDRGRDVQDRRELATLAVAACRAIERIVVDASLTTLRRQEIDLAALVRETVAAARLGGAHVEPSLEGGLPRCDGDPVRLRQALDNLVANAVAWSPAGQAVVVGAREAAGKVVLFVRDRGPGVPAGERERIFEPGTRLDAGRPGSGLGLAIVRSIAEAHGGSADVVTGPGRGATFRIHLPVAAG